MNAEDNNNPTPTDPEHGGPASVVDKHDLIWRTKELFEFISKRAAAGRLTTATRRGKATLGREFFEEELDNIDKECHGIYLNKTADEAAKDWNGNMKHRHAASWAAAMSGTFSIGSHEENATSDHRVAMRELTKRRAAAATEKMEVEAKAAAIKSQLSIENAQLAVLLKKQKLAVVYAKQTRKKGPLHADLHGYFSTGGGQKSMLLASFNEEDEDQADIDGAAIVAVDEQGDTPNAGLNDNRAAAVVVDNENPAGNVVLNDSRAAAVVLDNGNPAGNVVPNNSDDNEILLSGDDNDNNGGGSSPGAAGLPKKKRRELSGKEQRAKHLAEARKNGRLIGKWGKMLQNTSLN